MNLRYQAESDLEMTLQDGETGFGIPTIIEDDAGHAIGNDADNPFYCQVGRVNFIIDPDTGVQVEGNFAHISARMADLIEAGFEIDGGCKTWKITAPDIDQRNGGQIRSYKVKTPRIDHTLGLVTLICGAFTRENTANEAIISTIMSNLE